MYGIALTGYMGGGKTEVGKQLAEKVGVDFIDSDDETKKLLNGLEIPDYIDKYDSESTNSECKFPNFRDKETAALMNTISQNRNNSVILSLGGGALTESQAIRNNLLLYLASYKIIFIDTDIEKILERKNLDIYGNVNRKKVDDRSLFKERYPLYNKHSDLTVYNNGSVQNTINQILENTCMENFVNGMNSK